MRLRLAARWLSFPLQTSPIGLPGSFRRKDVSCRGRIAWAEGLRGNRTLA
ncbi:hypothetical protein JRQ81_015287 [Phrynocephalus forsythii]|uniref:Uncharacterized protein n=1 Tax=Phrynocephalus forsythii TaxID=171643 RepID=A0A9Q0XTQ0_9SAUR|nr:hypothetical protein JRQ81_015287 [Phrynocephalus forsythii]